MGMFDTDTDIVIVHDGKLAGGLGATVLARLLRRRHGVRTLVSVRPLPPRSTSETFWQSEADNLVALPDIAEKTVVLFGITFLDVDSDMAMKKLQDIRTACRRLSIWSHRWPDEFSSFLERVSTPERDLLTESIMIPPDDIITDEELGILLNSDEKRLLRATLYSVATIPRDSPEDDRLISSLNQWIAKNSDSAWGSLESSFELEDLLDRIVDEYIPEDNLTDYATVDLKSPNKDFLEVSVNGADAPARKLEILDAVCDSSGVNDQAVVLAWLNSDRVMLYRRDLKHQLPSLRWLIENRYNNLVPEELRGSHYGPQNSVYFKVSEAVPRSELRDLLKELATKCASTVYGGRYLQAAIARDIASTANEVMASVDLEGKYTSRTKPDITVDAAKLYELIHKSSRTGKTRRTLVMPVDAAGAKATAFLFRDGGYNFQKIERILEGVLIGLKRRNLRWLGEDSVPDRLRIDVRPNVDSDNENIVDSIQAAPMKSIDAHEHLVSDKSLIGKFLKVLQMNKLVSYAESETIGPSVAHALALFATAQALQGPIEQQKVRVLDLFAGSGVAHRLLGGKFDVVSVDLYVAASSVGLEAGDYGLWLKADARRVLDSTDPIIERKFDVIGLDPPHSELLELLFGSLDDGRKTLVELSAERADIMVMYQGHTTQRGRLRLVEAGLKRANWVQVTTLQVEEELIVIAGRGEYAAEESFGKLLDTIGNHIETFVQQNSLDSLEINTISPEW
ncbi:hypothetical protein A3E20_00620 [Candidatus Saccharibacteria bacterium RIFCSPHIGHO2_12_FULL_47_16]|nr:MAG: hypothetical protein A3E20_00620 [Candidatus Saccharibacteria bacterium RIFCSPHIGHO2_12_FULL_47_16]